MALRILHTFSAPTGPTTDQRLTTESAATRTRAGCREAEAYRSLSDPDEVAVVELWDDEDAYGSYVASGPTTLVAELAAADRAGTEIYAHEYFTPTDGVWTAAGRHPGRRVVWPARGQVRIVIQTGLADLEEARAGLGANEVETRREAGCLEFAWMSSVEEPGHVLLLEAWETQARYDQHWNLRRRTGSAPARRAAKRTHGSEGAEFYRRQEFRLLYGHWLPADGDGGSMTVDWPA